MATYTDDAFVWVISIAGLGKRGVASITPLGLSTGDLRDDSDTLFQDEYAQLILPGSVRFSGTSVAPLSQSPRAGTLRFTIIFDDDNYPEVSEFFAASRKARAWATRMDRGVDIDWDDTSHSLQDTPTSAGIAVNDIVHIGREGYRVASINDAASKYAIVSTVPDGSGGTMARTSAEEGDEGHFGTFMTNHPSQPTTDNKPPYEDDRVWETNPVIIGREVILYSATGDGLEEVEGRYIVASDPVFGRDGTTVELTAHDPIAILAQSKVNYRPNVYSVFGPPTLERYITSLMFRGKTSDEVAEDRVWETGDLGVFQIDKTVYLLNVDADGPRDRDVRGDLIPRFGSEGPTAMTGEMFEDAGDFAGKVAHELLVTDPLDGTTPHRQSMSDASKHPYYTTDTAFDGNTSQVVTHPLDMLLQHLDALDSNLPDHWKVRLPSDWVDIDGIQDLARKFPHLSPWTGVVAGKDGKAIPALKFLANFTMPVLGSLAINDDSEITVRSFLDLDVIDPIGVDRILFGRGARIDSKFVVDEVMSKTAIQFDGNPRVRIHTAEGYRSVYYRYQQRNIELDYAGLVHPDADITGDITGLPQIRAVLADLQMLGEMLRFPPRTHRISATDADVIEPGVFYAFTGPGFRDAESGLVATGNYTFVGWVMSVRTDDDRAFNQVCDVLELPFDIVRIGPAAKIASFDNVDTVTCLDVLYIESVDGAGEYNVDDETLTTDVQQFASGQKVILCAKDLSVKVSGLEVDTVTPGSKTIKFTTSPTYTWASGDILTLADYDDCTAADQAEFAFLAESRFTA